MRCCKRQRKTKGPWTYTHLWLWTRSILLRDTDRAIFGIEDFSFFDSFLRVQYYSV